jgi:hypothetical protein
MKQNMLLNLTFTLNSTIPETLGTSCTRHKSKRGKEKKNKQTKNTTYSTEQMSNTDRLLKHPSYYSV